MVKDNQVALREANRELNYIDSRLAKSLQEMHQLKLKKIKCLRQFGKEVDKLPGGISYFFEGQTSIDSAECQLLKVF